MKNTFGRRDLVKGAAAAGLTAAIFKPGFASANAVAAQLKQNGLPTQLQPHPLIKGTPSSESFWAQVRQAFPLPPRGEYCHYNTGTTGSQPWFSINNLAVYNVYKSKDPVYWQNNLAADFSPELFESPTGGSHQTAIYGDLADMYGANPDELVLTYNTSDGMQLTMAGIKWNAGDRIVTTNMEHPCGMGSVAWARDMFGVSVSVVDIPFDGGFDMTPTDWAELFRPALAAPLPAGAKQFVLVSHVSYKTGFVMPLKELSAVAHSFGNTWVIVDSAHGWGQLPMNLHDYGIDFLAGAGHKWLCGGPGTGILYVRNSSGSYPYCPFNPWTEGWGDLWRIPSARFNVRNASLTSGVQSRGEWNRPASFAMADTARFYNYIGVQNIFDRGAKLQAYFAAKIAERWGPSALWVKPTANQAFRGFVTAFNPFKGNTIASNYAAQTAAIAKIVSNLQASIDPGLNLTGQVPIYLASRAWPNHNADGVNNRCCFRVSTHAMYCSNEETDFVVGEIAKQVDATGIPQLP